MSKRTLSGRLSYLVSGICFLLAPRANPALPFFSSQHRSVTAMPDHTVTNIDCSRTTQGRSRCKFLDQFLSPQHIPCSDEAWRRPQIDGSNQRQAVRSRPQSCRCGQEQPPCTWRGQASGLASPSPSVYQHRDCSGKALLFETLGFDSQSFVSSFCMTGRTLDGTACLRLRTLAQLQGFTAAAFGSFSLATSCAAGDSGSKGVTERLCCANLLFMESTNPAGHRGGP